MLGEPGVDLQLRRGEIRDLDHLRHLSRPLHSSAPTASATQEKLYSFFIAAQQRSALLVLAVHTLVIPTFNFAPGAGVVTFVWVTSSLFYYLLGAYAHQHLRLNGRIAALGLGSLAVDAVAIFALVLLQGRYPKWIIRPECPLVALWSLFLFLAGVA